MIAPLAQTSPPTALYLWIAVLIALVVVGGIVTAVIRKRLLTDHSPDGLILDDIRRLRREGQLSESEYERLRAAIIGEATPPSTLRQAPKPDTDPLERRAPRGFDLTGDPLPDLADPPESPPPEGR